VTGETACRTKKSSRRATKQDVGEPGAKAPPGKAAAGKIACPTKRQSRKGSMTALACLLTNKLKHIPQKSGMQILCTVR
jgi:hypothetical protein